MTDMSLDEELIILEGLDFDIECNLPVGGCSNTATWLLTMLCCRTEYRSCDEHRKDQLEKLRRNDNVRCRVCNFGWDTRTRVVLEWTKL